MYILPYQTTLIHFFRSELLGSVLRLDVSDPNVPYKIPPDNPYVNEPGARPEIYVIGIRCAFSAGIDRGDRITGMPSTYWELILKSP